MGDKKYLLYCLWAEREKKRSRADIIITVHHHHQPTHNFLKLIEGWFSLSFSSQTIQNIISISHFKFSKFQNSWQLEIKSKLPFFELDSKVALTRWQLNFSINLSFSVDYCCSIKVQLPLWDWLTEWHSLVDRLVFAVCRSRVN